MKSQPKYLIFCVVVALLIAIAYFMIQANQLPLVLLIFGVGGSGFLLIRDWKKLQTGQRLILIIGIASGLMTVLQMWMRR